MAPEICVAFGPNESYVFYSPNHISKFGLPKTLDDIFSGPQAVRIVHDLALGPDGSSFFISFTNIQGQKGLFRQGLPQNLDKWLVPVNGQGIVRDLPTIQVAIGPNGSYFASDKLGATWANLPVELENVLKAGRDANGAFIHGKLPSCVTFGPEGSFVYINQLGSAVWSSNLQRFAPNLWEFLVSHSHTTLELNATLCCSVHGRYLLTGNDGNCDARIPEHMHPAYINFATDWKMTCAARHHPPPPPPQYHYPPGHPHQYQQGTYPPAYAMAHPHMPPHRNSLPPYSPFPHSQSYPYPPHPASPTQSFHYSPHPSQASPAPSYNHPGQFAQSPTSYSQPPSQPQVYEMMGNSPPMTSPHQMGLSPAQQPGAPHPKQGIIPAPAGVQELGIQEPSVPPQQQQQQQIANLPSPHLAVSPAATSAQMPLSLQAGVPSTTTSPLRKPVPSPPTFTPPTNGAVEMSAVPQTTAPAGAVSHVQPAQPAKAPVAEVQRAESTGGANWGTNKLAESTAPPAQGLGFV